MPNMALVRTRPWVGATLFNATQEEDLRNGNETD